MDMHRTELTETFSDSDLREFLEHSNELLLTVDEIIEVIPPPEGGYAQQSALRLLFMEARMASYDICILVESLLDNDRHLFSRAIEFSIRLLWETTIDYFYISEVDNSIHNPVAEQYLEFLKLSNSREHPDHKENRKAFEDKYENTNRGDYWSGKSRKEKITLGVNKQPDSSLEPENLKFLFEYLNEQVHGNILVGFHWDFNKHGRFEYQTRGQVVAGLLNIWLFYLLSVAYCRFTGRGSEIKRFECYETYVKPIFERGRNSQNEKLEKIQ